MPKGLQARCCRLMIGLIALTAFSVGLYAHPLGEFSVSHFARLAIGTESIGLRYVVDMAEISTFQELAKIDTNDDRFYKSRVRRLLRGRGEAIRRQSMDYC